MLRTFIRNNKMMIALTMICVAAVAVLVVTASRIFRSTSLAVSRNEGINPTAISVESMRQIGEWEFLTISNEELVDTTRRRFFSDDELVRIYYGELRLGIDMSQLRDDAIQTRGDSVVITLPKVILLDDDFIDEARTKSFYSTGRWDGKAHEALYQKAKRQMKARCLTPENMARARINAIAQVEKMVHSLGVKNVSVR